MVIGDATSQRPGLQQCSIDGEKYRVSVSNPIRKQRNIVGRRKGDNELKVKDWLGYKERIREMKKRLYDVSTSTLRGRMMRWEGVRMGRGEEFTWNSAGFHKEGIVSKKGLVDTT